MDYKIIHSYFISSLLTRWIADAFPLLGNFFEASMGRCVSTELVEYDTT